MTVEGIDKLKANFVRLGKKLSVAAHPAMLEGADRVVQTAKALVPKDTGHLASTIKRSDVEKTRKKQNDMVVISAGDDTTLVGARKQFQLARLIEFGTQNRPAEPYMRPAWRQHKASITSKMRRAISDAIRRGV
jgi:HK97 gp10 family phage protein